MYLRAVQSLARIITCFVAFTAHVGRLQDPATAATLTAALATYLPRSTTSRASSCSIMSAPPLFSNIRAECEREDSSALQPMATTSRPPVTIGESRRTTLAGSGLEDGPESMTNTVVSHSMLGKRTVTLTSTHSQKRTVKSSVFPSVELQAPTVVEAPSIDIHCWNVSDEQPDDAESVERQLSPADEESDSSSVHGVGQRQYFVRLTSSSAPFDHITEQCESAKVTDLMPMTTRHGAMDVDNDIMVTPSTSQNPTHNSVSRAPSTISDVKLSGVETVTVKFQDELTTLHLQQPLVHIQQQQQQQDTPASSFVNDPQLVCTAQVEALNRFASSLSQPLSGASSGCTTSSVVVSTASVISSFARQTPARHSTRGSTGVFTVCGRQTSRLPTSAFSCNRGGVPSALPSTFREIREGSGQQPRTLAEGATTSYTPILPAPTASSIPVPVLAISEYGPGHALNYLTPTVSSVSSGSYHRPLVTGTVMRGSQLPTDPGLVGVIQHAPASFKPSTIYLPSGQSLICVPRPNGVATTTGGLLCTSSQYSGVPLQQFAVVPSSNAVGFGHQATTILPLSAFSVVQPFSYNKQLKQQLPPQLQPAIGNRSLRTNDPACTGLRISQAPLQSLHTVTQPKIAMTNGICSPKRPLQDLSWLMPSVQRQKQPQQEREAPQQQKQQPPPVYFSTTRLATTGKATQQKKAVSSATKVDSFPLMSTPYYLRRCRGRAGHDINVPEAVDGNDAGGSNKGNSGRIRVKFFKRPKRIYRKTVEPRHRNHNLTPVDFESQDKSSVAKSDGRPSYKTSPESLMAVSTDEIAMAGSRSSCAEQCSAQRSVLQRQQSDLVGDMPPLAMLEALCLRINVDIHKTSSPF